MRSVLILLVAVLFISPAKAQAAFEPHTVAYALCVMNETKELALAMPEIAKVAIIECMFAFR